MSFLIQLRRCLIYDVTNKKERKMDITQIIAFSFIATFIVILLKQYKPEYAMIAMIAAGIFILLFVINKLSSVIVLLEELTDKIGINKEFFVILFKITGIAYIVEFASNICKDAGESAIASKVELAGKIVIVTLSIPIFSTLIQTMSEII